MTDMTPTSSRNDEARTAAMPAVHPVDRTWLAEALNDISVWVQVMPSDADGRVIDWDWVRSLDLAHGIGVAGNGADPNADDTDIADPWNDPHRDVHDLLKRDYAIRDRLEAIIAQCSTAFMGDFDRLIDSYRLPRALAYANRRLNDEIALLIDRGVRERRWTVTYERRRRATVPVLHPLDDADTAAAGGPTVVVRQLDDIQDRTADILDARAESRKRRHVQRRAGSRDMARANLNGVTSPGGTATLFDAAHSGERVAGAGTGAGIGPAGGTGVDGGSDSGTRGATATYPGTSDWRDAYLPGRDVDTVMGIDIETTGIDPARVYIIDVGFEYMDMAAAGSSGPSESSESTDGGALGRNDAAADAHTDVADRSANGYRYEETGYVAGDAYGQSRLSFGVPDGNARLGNPLIARLTGIDVRERGASAGYRLFDEWPAAQRGLLARLERQPYVAHNATFEHGFFMLNVEGYAERYRDGGITIIDTLPMSRRWDPGSVPDDAHPYGDNTLESYAKRQGALAADGSERHLGLEDAHIMLVAMKHHLSVLRAEGCGPWGAGGRPGTGGKRCGGSGNRT